MIARCLRIASCAAIAVGVVAGVVGTAHAADQGWNGRYSLVTYASEKSGSSIAARQSENDFSAQFVLETDCSSGTCIATVVDGPAPSNPTIPQPARYTWDGSRWTWLYDWQWECHRGDNTPRQYARARSRVFYAPNPDGSLSGTWSTDIYEGACRGSVVIPVSGYPVV